MKRREILFMGGMVVVAMLIFLCSFIGLWPTALVEMRAEVGDQGAIHEMYRRDVFSNQGRNTAYWAGKMRKLTTHDLTLMSEEDRKIFELLGTVQNENAFFPGPEKE